MRTKLSAIAILVVGLVTGCEDKKATVPTAFAPQPNVSAGGAGGAGQGGKQQGNNMGAAGAAKIEQ